KAQTHPPLTMSRHIRPTYLPLAVASRSYPKIYVPWGNLHKVTVFLSRTFGGTCPTARLTSEKGNADDRITMPPKLSVNIVNVIRIRSHKTGSRLCCASQSRASPNS